MQIVVTGDHSYMVVRFPWGVCLCLEADPCNMDEVSSRQPKHFGSRLNVNCVACENMCSQYELYIKLSPSLPLALQFK